MKPALSSFTLLMLSSPGLFQVQEPDLFKPVFDRMFREQREANIRHLKKMPELTLVVSCLGHHEWLATAEAKLKRVGVKLVSHRTDVPMLGIYAIERTRNLWTADVREPVSINRNGSWLIARTWDAVLDQRILGSGREDTDMTRWFNLVLDQFCNDWLKANKK